MKMYDTYRADIRPYLTLYSRTPPLAYSSPLSFRLTFHINNSVFTPPYDYVITHTNIYTHL